MLIAKLFRTLISAPAAIADAADSFLTTDAEYALWTREKPILAANSGAEVAVPTVTAKSITDVGAGPVATPCRQVAIKAPNSGGAGGSKNTKTIYVGFSDVTVANGFPLEPGEPTSFEVLDASLIFTISGDAAQKARVFIVTK